ncbi:TetR/AcrR family transcriptional regulator [Streptosporangium subroseum]|uniref:TetR/AcrR family transcriptional regulator n=1 Tax=Streptosporangium subroseum TaxID=106412 RepID=UPI00343C6963
MTTVSGRPREFDIDTALDQAVQIFWRQGYEGTAISDLAETLGINRPSLYAAFGNKEALFRKALDRYTATVTSYVQEAFEEPTARRVAERLMLGAADATTREGCPQGCMGVQGALAASVESDRIRYLLSDWRAAAQVAVQGRFERARSEGDLPPGVDPAELAGYVTAVMYGIAVRAASGATNAELRRTATFAAQSLPW